MLQVRPFRRKRSIIAQAQMFMARWDVTSSSEDELRFYLRDRTLTHCALNDAMERVVRCTAGGRTRFVFDLSGVIEMESCYSVISALFIRFARQVGKQCQITGLHPRFADVMAYFFRRAGRAEFELARQAGVASQSSSWRPHAITGQ